jgi:hypothetical protein
MISALIFQEEPIVGRFEGLCKKGCAVRSVTQINRRTIAGADGSRLARSACHVRG